MKLYKNVLLPTLFTFSGHDAERAHYAGLRVMRMLGAIPIRQIIEHFTRVHNPREVFGLTFPNPVGLAAGFDKNAVALYGAEALGFGFAEVGTVTNLPQEGNPRPRLFRLSEDEAIINRMGFNNYGKEYMASKLASYKKRKIPLGINIGKGKNTPLNEAAAEYEAMVETLYDYADYITVNVSSPNTKDIRNLQERVQLEKLLTSIKNAVRKTAKGRKTKPVLLKIAPDLTKEELDDILTVCEGNVQGIIVHNTSIARPEHLRSKYKAETGGLSGKPLTENALGMVSYVHRTTPKLPIVGVGGIFTPDDAKRMFDAGASLIQLYTGLIYEGPGLPSRINRALH